MSTCRLKRKFGNQRLKPTTRKTFFFVLKNNCFPHTQHSQTKTLIHQTCEPHTDSIHRCMAQGLMEQTLHGNTVTVVDKRLKTRSLLLRVRPYPLFRRFSCSPPHPLFYSLSFGLTGRQII